MTGPVRPGWRMRIWARLGHASRWRRGQLTAPRSSGFTQADLERWEAAVAAWAARVKALDVDLPPYCPVRDGHYCPIQSPGGLGA